MHRLQIASTAPTAVLHLNLLTDSVFHKIFLITCTSFRLRQRHRLHCFTLTSGSFHTCQIFQTHTVRSEPIYHEIVKFTMRFWSQPGQENLIWCAFNGLESAYLDFFYSDLHLYPSKSYNFTYHDRFSFPQNFPDHMHRLQIASTAPTAVLHLNLWKLPHGRYSPAKHHVSEVHLIGYASYFN